MLGLGKYFKAKKLVRKYAERNVIVNFPVKLGKKIEFEGDNRIAANCNLDGRIGRGTYISANCVLKADIGRFCSIAWNVQTIIGRHPIDGKHVSTSPAFFSVNGSCGKSYHVDENFAEYKYADEERKQPVIIGNDVWIGADVRLIGGIKIADGAAILAGSVVTKDVPPYAIVGGVPAKILKYRFPDEQIAALVKLKWWDKDEKWLKENAKLFGNITELLKKQECS